MLICIIKSFSNSIKTKNNPMKKITSNLVLEKYLISFKMDNLLKIISLKNNLEIVH